MTERTTEEQARAAEEHVELAKAAVVARENQLGRPLTEPERRWLLGGLFRHRYGETLGDAVTEEVLSRLGPVGETGVRRRGR